MQPEYRQPVADYPRVQGSYRGARTAYLDGDNACSYEELDRRSSQIANGLIAAGCSPGDRIAFMGVNSGSFVEAFFGACKARAVYVGINWRLTAAELGHILSDAGPALIFCDPEFFPLVESLQAQVPSLRTIVRTDAAAFNAWLEQFSGVDPHLRHLPDDGIIQFYTSGTTGKPKGVVITNRAMGEHRRGEDGFGSWYLHSDGHEVTINAMPNFHIGGLGWLLISLFRGATVVLMPSPDPVHFLDLIERHRVSHLFAVPVVLGMMVAEQKKRPRDLASLKVLHYGSSSIAPALLREALAVMKCGFAQYYGMTETIGSVTVMSPQEHDPDNPARLKSCGRAVPGAEISIRDAEGRELPANSAGEIWVRTDSIMREYWNLPEATAEAFSQGWYRSGDGGYVDEDGYLYMADRIRDMIISGAENIYPMEVENALYEHPAVAEVAVIGVADEKWGEAVKAIIVPASGERVTGDALIAFLRERLAGYKIPRIYQFVSELPRTPSGKIQKYRLREQPR